MKGIIRRIPRLEQRFGPAVETVFSRRLRERLEAGRRRVAHWREREGISISDQDKGEHLGSK